MSMLLVAVSAFPTWAELPDNAPLPAYILTQTEDALLQQADEASPQASDTLIDQLQLASEVSVRLQANMRYETEEGVLSSNQQIFFSSYMGLDGDGFGELSGAPLHWNGRTFSMSFEQRYPDRSDSFVWRIEGTVSADAQTLESLTLFLEMHHCLPFACSDEPTDHERLEMAIRNVPFEKLATAPEWQTTYAVQGTQVQNHISTLSHYKTAFSNTGLEIFHYVSTQWDYGVPTLTISFRTPMSRLKGNVTVPIKYTDSNRGFPAAVRQSEQAPLAGVAVDLVRLEQDAGGNQQIRRLESTYADKAGQYEFVSVPITTSLALSVSLQSEDLWVLDASGSPNNYDPLPTPANSINLISLSFDVTTDAGITIQDLAFDRAGPFTSPGAGSTLLQRLDHFGLIYYHTRQALDLAALLGVTLDTKPLSVYGYLPNRSGAYWRGPDSAGSNATIPPHIVIGGKTPAGGVAPSHVNDGSRPDNREWHEFGHHFMADAFGNLMPRVLPRVNHDGYKNPTTSDSWTEGFAEFFSLLINREIAVDGTPPQLYHWAGTASNLETNWISWNFRNSQSFEEFAVASLLWDLLDPVDPKDVTILTRGTGAAQVKASYADRVEVPLATLWTYLSHSRGGDYGYNLHIKHLYDVLAANGVGATVGANGLTALDELFVAHGFFSDTGAHRYFYDAGETIGATGYLAYTVGGVEIPSRPQRPSPPPVPDAYVHVAVTDGSGAPVAVTRFDVDVRFDAPFDLYNFTYEATATDNRLFFLPAPSHYPATISVTPQGLTVDAPLVLTNEFVWTAPADANGLVRSHTFQTGGSASGNLYLPAITNTKAAPTPTFSDDFCNTASGWPQTDQSVYSLHYIAGPPCQYQIRINVDNRMAAATSGKSATDFSLESVVRLDSAHAGGAGLLFGLNHDWSRFYVMGIGTNGKFWLSRSDASEWTSIIPSTVSSLINRSAENHLRVESQGSRFTVYINGSQVGQVEESGSHSGRVGLYAEGVAAFDARFRNYILWDRAATSAGQREVSSEASASVHQSASMRFED